jgi:Family of unknown function (DUF5906)
MTQSEWLSEVEAQYEEIRHADAETQRESVEAVRKQYGKEAAEWLEALLGKARGQLPAVVPRLPAKVDVAVRMLNEHHAVIDSVGGKTVIASWEPSPLDPTKMVVVFQGKDSFLLRYSNRTVLTEEPDGRGGKRSRAVRLGEFWLDHPMRRQYRGVTFMPGGQETEHGCLNLWQGWGVKDQPGDWSLIRQHIKEVIAGGNEVFGEYVVRWIAWSIQHPDRQAEAALVLIGLKGTGKGTLVRVLERVFGAHAFQVNSREEVVGKFNGHLQDCVLFVADEAYWGGDVKCVGRLQGMITEPKLSIERKGMDLIEVPNRLHVVMLAEPGWVIPAGRHERRYAAVEVSDCHRGDREYFKALHGQIAEGGAEGMFYDLKRMELGGWHPRDIPEELLQSAALQKQKVLTLRPLERWYYGLLQDGELPGRKWPGDYPAKAYTTDILSDAKEEEPRLRLNLSEVGLTDFLKDEVGCEQARTSLANGWEFPPLAECRARFEERYGPMTKWNAATEWASKVRPVLMAPMPKPKPTEEAPHSAVAVVVPLIKRRI